MLSCPPHRIGPVKYYELSGVGSGLLRKSGTFLYVWNDLIIDSGGSSQMNQVRTIIEKEKPAACLLTHHHAGHSGNLPELFIKNIPVHLHSKGIEILKPVYLTLLPELVLYKAGMVEIRKNNLLDPFHILPIPTPGHAPDHLCFYVPEEGILFSGDLYLGPEMLFCHKEDDIPETIRSIIKILDFDFEFLCCAHQPVFHNGKEALKTKLEFLENFCGLVKELYHKGQEKKNILNSLPTREKYLLKYLSGGKFSLLNMVSSVIKEEQQILFGAYVEKNLLDPASQELV